MPRPRTGRAVEAEIRQFVREQYTIINECIKPRPWFVPLWFWSFGARIFIDVAKMRDFIENGIAAKDERR